MVKALPFFGGASFFVLNSDSIWVEGAGRALSTMTEQWNPQRMDGLLLLADRTSAMGYDGMGDFALKADSQVVRAKDHAGPAFAYPGVQIVHPRLFDNAPDGPFSTNLMWDRAIAKGRLFGTLLDGVWIHVGTPEARDQADAYLSALA